MLTRDEIALLQVNATEERYRDVDVARVIENERRRRKDNSSRAGKRSQARQREKREQGNLCQS
jgi:hypothetical protein